MITITIKMPVYAIKMVEKFSDYYHKNKVTPSLCHGDLWFGNVLFSKHEPYLIDPDALYADREFDIAMTMVFGGFSNHFYRAYNEVCKHLQRLLYAEPLYAR